MKNLKKWTALFCTLTLCLVVGFTKSNSQNSNRTLLKNATVINPADQTSGVKDILVEGQKIVSIAAFLQDDSAQVVDLTGKFILPGFVDAHIHPVGNAGAIQEFEYLGFQGTVERALQSGVVTVLDVFSDERENFSFRQHQDKMIGADFYTSGSCFTSTNGHCTEYQVPTRTIDTPDQARQSVKDLIVTKQPDLIKIVYDNAYTYFQTIDEATMRAAVETANQLDVKTMIHIGTWENAAKALDAGATSITHNACAPIPDKVINLFLEKNAYFIPTLVVQTDLLNKVTHPNLWTDPLAKRVVPKKLLNEYLDVPNYNPTAAGFLSFQKSCADHQLENVKKAWNAGVKILTGTDIPNSGTFVGYSVHREMDLFAMAGVQPWEVLKSSTVNGYEFLGADFGLEIGKTASLVILNSSPLEDISNTKDIFKVLHRGNWIPLQTVK